jgi:lysozyme
MRSQTKKRIYSNLIGFGFIFILAFFIVYGYNYWRHPAKPISKVHIPSKYLSIGIDISHHQGEINWPSLFIHSSYDTLIHFVYCKATEGEDFFDTQFSENRKKLNELGIFNGAYHFYRPKTSPITQAAHFLNTYTYREIDLPPVLDVEIDLRAGDEKLREGIRQWLEIIEEKTGQRPIIYCPLNFYKNKFKDHFPEYQFWIAAYSSEPIETDDEQVIMWQFTDRGIIPGIKEKVDLNFSKFIP